jgi:hypothetical protein
MSGAVTLLSPPPYVFLKRTGKISSLNPLPLLFKSLLPGQEDCVFISGHLNLHAKPETGIPTGKKIIKINLKKTE